MRFHVKRSEIRDIAEEKYRDSQADRDFMLRGQRSETELRRSTGTHILNGISWQKVRSEIELRRSTWTHKLNGISWQEVRDQRQS